MVLHNGVTPIKCTTDNNSDTAQDFLLTKSGNTAVKSNHNYNIYQNKLQRTIVTNSCNSRVFWQITCSQAATVPHQAQNHSKKLWATVTKAEINSWHTRSFLPWVTSWDFRLQLWTPRRARGSARLRFPTHKSHYRVVCRKQEAAGPTAARQVNSGRLEQAPLRTDTSTQQTKQHTSAQGSWDNMCHCRLKMRHRQKTGM